MKTMFFQFGWFINFPQFGKNICLDFATILNLKKEEL